MGNLSVLKQSMLCVLLYTCHREERPPSLSYCCHGISNSGQNRTIHDKEVMRVWSALIHWDTGWYPMPSTGYQSESGYLLRLHFFEKMSCVAAVRRNLNDKGKSCYAILNSPSSSMQITLSRCSLFFQCCSSLSGLRVSLAEERKLLHTH